MGNMWKARGWGSNFPSEVRTKHPEFLQLDGTHYMMYILILTMCIYANNTVVVGGGGSGSGRQGPAQKTSITRQA